MWAKAFGRRVSCVLLSCLTLLSLSSCFIVINVGKDEETSGTTVAADITTADTTVPYVPGTTVNVDELTPEEQAVRDLESLINYDMKGKTLIISTTDVDVPKPAGSVRLLDGARWKVLTDVSERYNVEFIISHDEPEGMLAKLKDARTSGLYYADIVMFDSTGLGALYAEHLLSDLTVLPFLALDSEYYFSESVESATVNGKIYAAAGAASVNFDNVGCIYYNNDMMSSISGESIFDTVKNGAWTLEKMLELAKLASTGTDGTPTGVTGVASEYDAGTAALHGFEGSGIGYTYTDEKGLQVFSPVGLPFDTVDLLSELFYSPLFGIELAEEEKQQYWDEESQEFYLPSQFELFRTGKSLFYSSTLYDLKRLYVSKYLFMPLPMPKANAEQESYVSSLGGKGLLFAIPSDGANLTESAIIMEALNVRSNNYIRDAYLNNYLYYYAKDERSIDMVELITQNYYFDLAVNFGNHYPALAAGTTGTVVQTLTYGHNLLDVHFWNYYGAIDALIRIESDLPPSDPPPPEETTEEPEETEEPENTEGTENTDNSENAEDPGSQETENTTEE